MNFSKGHEMTLMAARAILSADVYRGWTVLGMVEVLSGPFMQPLKGPSGTGFPPEYVIGRCPLNLKGRPDR
jgi:hypothetical protein